MELYIYGIIYTFIYAFLCKMFVESFARKREYTSQAVLWIVMLLFTVLDYVISVLLENYFIIKQVLIVLIGTVSMWYLFQIRMIKSILLVIFYQGFCIAADYIAWMLLQRFLQIGQMQSTIMNLLMGTLSQVFVFFFILVLRRKFSQDNTELLTDFEWVKFSVFPILTMLGIVAMLLNFKETDDIKQMITLTSIAAGMLLLNIFVFYLLNGAIQREKRIRRERLSMEKARSELEMYQQISESFDRQKKREHEYKNQMVLLSSLARQKEWEKLNELFETYHSGIDHQMDSIDTNHVIVNSILNVKYQEAIGKGIVFVLKINDLSGLRIKDQDIVVILSNMLNNAIEACEKCDGKKVIKFKAIKEDGKVIFSVINTIQESPLVFEGKYITTKEDGMYHGMGIENIKHIVEKYGGNCVIRNDEKQFYFIVYLPE